MVGDLGDAAISLTGLQVESKQAKEERREAGERKGGRERPSRCELTGRRAFSRERGWRNPAFAKASSQSSAPKFASHDPMAVAATAPVEEGAPLLLAVAAKN